MVAIGQLVLKDPKAVGRLAYHDASHSHLSIRRGVLQLAGRSLLSCLRPVAIDTNQNQQPAELHIYTVPLKLSG
jgi:hypothetical protein